MRGNRADTQIEQGYLRGKILGKFMGGVGKRRSEGISGLKNSNFENKE